MAVILLVAAVNYWGVGSIRINIAITAGAATFYAGSRGRRPALSPGLMRAALG